MTNEEMAQLDEIKGWEAQATPGEWYVDPYGVLRGGDGYPLQYASWDSVIFDSASDAIFCANARQVIPWLVEMVERQEARIKTLELALPNAPKTANISANESANKSAND